MHEPAVTEPEADIRSPIVASAHPAAVDRLTISANPGDEIPEAVQTPAAPRQEAKKKVGVLKSIELFFRGLARAGTTYRRAKGHERHLETVDRRLEAAEEALRHVTDVMPTADLSERIEALEADLGISARQNDGRRMLDRLAQMEQELGLEPREGVRTVLSRIVKIEELMFSGYRQHIEANARSIAEIRREIGLGDAPASGPADGKAGAVSLRASIDHLADEMHWVKHESEELRADHARTKSALGRAEEAVRTAQDKLDGAAGEHALLARAYSDLSRRLDLLRFHGTASDPEALSQAGGGTPEAPEGLEALLEAFYARLEDRFRGSREEIKRRLTIYLPDAQAAQARTGGLSILDIGCGRGEWLELLAENGVTATGVDINPQQTAEAAAMGLDIVEADAFVHLAGLPDASLAMVSAHHLIEHLPVERVVALTREALRVLAPGGVLLYETPDPRNLLVGATSFHVDPTHLKPLPREVLTVLFDTVGFHPVEVRHLHPHEKREAFIRDRRLDPEIANLMFGPQDLAVLGTKPA